jgi:hypothetical protein
MRKPAITRSSHAAFLALLGVLLACSAQDESAGSDTEVRGDTAIVRANGTGVWRRPKNLQEDLRITGPEGVGFADPTDLAVGPDGSILASDMQADQVFRFSAAGDYLGKLGRSGSGPGEYRVVNGVAVRPDGRILVREPRKVLMFRPDGTYETEWPLASILMSDRAITPSPDGSLAMKILRSVSEPFRDVDLGFLLISPTGEVVDTLGSFPTPWDHESVSGQLTHVHRHVEWSPDGYPVAAVSSRLAFQVFRPEGILRVERDAERVAFLPEERAEWEAYYRWLRERWGARGHYILPTPELKPMFQSMGIARTGEVWFRRTVPSEQPAAHRVPMIAGLTTPPVWDEPLLLEVFSREGRYLGSIKGKSGINVRLLSGDTVWAYEVNDDGEKHIVRYLAK